MRYSAESLVMKLFKLLVPHIKLLHDGFCDEQSFFELFCVEALQVCHSKPLIGLLEEGLLGHGGQHGGLLEAHRGRTHLLIWLLLCTYLRKILPSPTVRTEQCHRVIR